ncbi:MAG TPA: CHAT domain-containing protein [Blastocatellia bacterium]|nr:CHAT domain-containing protein [Blastocatellia bacterium]
MALTPDGKRTKEQKSGAKAKTPAIESAEEASQVQLQVQVVRGDITQVEAPVVVVGHYKGVAPIKAVGALDAAMGHWISQAGERGMIGGNLGELFFIPVTQKQIVANSILLGGMGDYGQFTYDDLRYLLMNISYAISALRLDRFATVLIGSGEGSLDLEEAAKGMVSGICDALHHFDKTNRNLKEMILVEKDHKRFEHLIETFDRFVKDKPFENINLSLLPPLDMPDVAPAPTAPRRDGGGALLQSRFANRITIEQGEEGFQFSALTNSAVIPIRKVEVQRFFTEGIAESLKKSTPGSMEKFARLLHKYIFPEDFERLIMGKPLTLVLDSTTASLPWEMACFGPHHRKSYFGTDLKLTRQFRTMLSSPPGIAPPINKSLRFLVIADPADDDGEFALPSAHEEGEAVVALLEEFKEELIKSNGIEITIESRIGAEDCDPVEILALILNETFDVIHYAGHGIFDKARPNRSGWVFRNSCILSAREIFRTRQVPRLIFANACFSSVTTEDKAASTALESNRKLAGMAEAFFERGVQNYIGAGWPVVDQTATTFATAFYEKALSGSLLSDALADARRKIMDDGSTTWGAYQHYGQSTARLVSLSEI